MDLPKVAAACPKQVQLEAGKKYAYCTCGLSANQPFCDGQHRGTDFTPLLFTADETKSVHLCQCKQTGRQPMCDGSHKKLDQPTTQAAIE
ncbi:MAG: CDGSH iron-sulfur domain-containing protein [Pirellulaceae bacterium]